MYLTVVPQKNDGKIIHHLSVKDVPVDGFWSISVYFEPNALNAYTVNNITAKKGGRRIDGGAVRWLRRQDGELPARHRRLELLGAPVSAACRDPAGDMEVSASHARSMKAPDSPLFAYPLLAQPKSNRAPITNAAGIRHQDAWLWGSGASSFLPPKLGRSSLAQSI